MKKQLARFFVEDTGWIRINFYILLVLIGLISFFGGMILDLNGIINQNVSF